MNKTQYSNDRECIHPMGHFTIWIDDYTIKWDLKKENYRNISAGLISFKFAQMMRKGSKYPTFKSKNMWVFPVIPWFIKKNVQAICKNLRDEEQMYEASVNFKSVHFLPTQSH